MNLSLIIPRTFVRRCTPPAIQEIPLCSESLKFLNALIKLIRLIILIRTESTRARRGLSSERVRPSASSVRRPPKLVILVHSVELFRK